MWALGRNRRKGFMGHHLGATSPPTFIAGSFEGRVALDNALVEGES
jgi:hypothetical protein